MLAVIEHISQPTDWVRGLVEHLHPRGQLVVTTPHARWEFLHGLGARLRLFSEAAVEQHDTLFDAASLAELGNGCGLEMRYYRRFMGPVNQLAVFDRPV